MSTQTALASYFRGEVGRKDWHPDDLALLEDVAAYVETLPDGDPRVVALRGIADACGVMERDVAGGGLEDDYSEEAGGAAVRRLLENMPGDPDLALTWYVRYDLAAQLLPCSIFDSGTEGEDNEMWRWRLRELEDVEIALLTALRDRTPK